MFANSFNDIREVLDSVSDDDVARINRRIVDPDVHADPTVWGNTKDPFGLDWAWVRPFTLTDQRSVIPIEDRSQPTRDSSSTRRLFAAVAAILLIAFGYLLSNGLRSESDDFTTLVADATPIVRTVRGTEEELRVAFESPISGYISLVVYGAQPKTPYVLPLPGDSYIQVIQDEPTDYGPLPDETDSVIVVVTAQPSNDAIQRTIDEIDDKAEAPSGDFSSPGNAEESIPRILESLGFQTVAVNTVSFDEVREAAQE